MARYLNRSYWESRTEQQNKPVQYNYASTNVCLILINLLFTYIWGVQLAARESF